MRLSKIKLTVRGMMVIVLAVAICLHLTTAAWRAYRSGAPHLHSAIVDHRGSPGKAVAVRSEPFWPAFLRRATGLCWVGGCFMGGDALMEMCELSNPEIRMPSDPNLYAPRCTPEQLKLVEKMSREFWSR
jgi:hypothetical protein